MKSPHTSTFSRLVWTIVPLVFFGTLPGLVSAEDSPNILFIFTDDQCFDTIGAVGNPRIETPAMDQLAQRGTRFSHCFNMGSWSPAVCVASRTMLNSGRYLWQAEQIYKESEAERTAGRWWSEYLKQAGYRTYMTGKWHCLARAQRAFDVVADVRGGMPNQTPDGYHRPAADGRDPWSASDPKFGGFWAGGKHWSEVVADHASDFLQQAKTHDEPFFMYIAFNAPHDPRQSPQEFLNRYPVDSIEVPPSFLPSYPFRQAMGAGEKLRDEMLAPFPRTTAQVQVHRREYYAQITHLDQQIGRILDALETTGQADNTWIFFTSDHGLAVGHHGLMGKQNMYDHSLRVPFLVVGPQIPEGQTIATPIYLQDVMPTTLELAGIPKPEHVQFASLLPILAGDSGQQNRSIYGAYLKKQRCIRTDRYKLIFYPDAKVARLYDLHADPDETIDLFDLPQSRPIVAALLRELIELQQELNDPLDLTQSFADLLQ